MECMHVLHNNSIHGVAIVLKKASSSLDNLGIQHTDESSIRRQLRKRSDCKTTANQHFLMRGSTSTDIDRKRGDTRNLSCVILPRKDIPKQFFSLISTGKFTVSSKSKSKLSCDMICGILTSGARVPTFNTTSLITQKN